MFRLYSVLSVGAAHRYMYVWIALLVCFFSTPARANNRLSFDRVSDIAKSLAAEPFKPPQPIPDFLKQLTYDQYRDIRFDPAQSLWKDAGGKF